MKKLISFTEADDLYLMSFEGGEAFSINKDKLELDTKHLYQIFFEGLTEKPEYELVDAIANPSKQAQYVFNTVNDLFSEITKRIEASWFDEVLSADEDESA